VAHPTAWQWVIHGPDNALREEVVRGLLALVSEKAAYRYALCGCGDVVKWGEGKHFISPRGCGHRLCPRCSRKSGQRNCRRVLKWLGTQPHGALFTMCLTQPVVKGETLRAARNRMVLKERRYLKRCKAAGMVAAMVSTHIVWSKGWQGWHYHVHLFMEFDRRARDPGLCPVGCQMLRDWWLDTGRHEHVQAEEDSCRLVMESGRPITSVAGDEGDTDFWTEGDTWAMRAVQYPVRDMVQGVSSLRFGGEQKVMEAAVCQLLTDSAGWKLRRTTGLWRKEPPAAVEVVEPVVADVVLSAAAPAGSSPSSVVGTLSGLYRAAIGGFSDAKTVFRELELNVRNKSDFARRYVRFCRSAWKGMDDG